MLFLLIFFSMSRRPYLKRYQKKSIKPLLKNEKVSKNECFPSVCYAWTSGYYFFDSYISTFDYSCSDDCQDSPTKIIYL